MSIIDQKNIDEWLFNYFEGNLSSQDREMLIRFLNANPALKADFDAWKASYVVEARMTYPNVSELLQPVPSTSLKKWIGLGLILIIILAMFVLFLFPEPVQQEKPSEFQIEQPAATQAPKEAKQAPAASGLEEKNTEDAGNNPQPATSPVGKENHISGKNVDEHHSEEITPFLMQRQAGNSEMLFNKQSPSSDSLEIIIKPYPASHPAGKSSKPKTRKKPMTVIRIRDTGF